MPFVQRRDNKVCGTFAVLQPGIAEEFLGDDDSEVIAFRNPPQTITAVSMRQARLALLSVGKLSAVDAAIQQSGDAARIEWEYAQELRRDNPLVSAMGSVLGLSGSELDELFNQAAKL